MTTPDDPRAPWRYTLNPTDEPGVVSLSEWGDEGLLKQMRIPADVLRGLVERMEP